MFFRKLCTSFSAFYYLFQIWFNKIHNYKNTINFCKVIVRVIYFLLWVILFKFSTIRYACVHAWWSASYVAVALCTVTSVKALVF